MKSTRSVFRSIKRELEAEATFADRVHGRSQRCYFWAIRMRGKLVTTLLTTFFYGLWGSRLTVFDTPEPVAVLAAWISVVLIAFIALKFASSNTITTSSVTALTPLPDSRTWNEYYVQQLSLLFFLIPGVFLCFFLVALPLPVSTVIKVLLVVFGSLSQIAICVLVAQLLVRVRWLAQWSGWWQVASGSAVGLAFVGLYPAAVERVAQAAIFPVLWIWPPAWPALILARPPAGIAAAGICAVFALAFVAVLLVLFLLGKKNAGRYRALEVYSWNEAWYVYGFSPLLNRDADIEAYDSWADTLLESGDTDPSEELSNSPSTLDAWLEEEHTTEQQRWADTFATFPLKLLSKRDTEILRVRCIESSGVYHFSWVKTGWRSLLLALILVLLPEQVSLIGGLGLAWVLFGNTALAIFQGGFIRFRSLPYRLEHIIAAEAKYRVLVASTLWLPILTATCLLGIRSGLSWLECLDLGHRLFFVLLLASVLYLYAIVFEKAENAWARWRTLGVVPAFVLGLAAAIGGGMLAVAEFGLPAVCGCVIAAAGSAGLYYLAIYWHYSCDVDYVETTAAK